MTLDFIQQTIEELSDDLSELSQRLSNLVKAKKRRKIHQEVVNIIEVLRRAANDLEEDLDVR
jgi:hypothetical protein